MTHSDQAAKNPAFPAAAREALEDIYRRVDRDLASTGAACWLRGQCCDFEKNDHVLWSSSVEIAYVRESRRETFPAGSELCPFWKDGMCTERKRRPLGCRTFFCDPAFRDRTQSIYERYHREIQAIAETWGLEYRYDPFVAALRGSSADS